VSTFFSNKYLKYRRLLERGAGAPSIVKDLACANCGYNLRGLKPGRVCPECGKVIPFDVPMAMDPMLGGDAARRSKTLWGLTLMTAAVACAVALRIGAVALWSFTYWPPLTLHASVKLAIALTWSIGVILALPRSMDAGRSLRRVARHLVVLSQVLWIPSVLCGLLALIPGLAASALVLAQWSQVLSVPAMIGAIGVALLLLHAADEIELDDAPRLIGLAVWTVPVLTGVLMFVPRVVGFVTLSLIGPLMLAWAWYMISFARGVWEFRHYVEWGMRQAGDVGDREARIAQTRAELQHEADSQVRTLPVPPHAPPTKPQPRRA